MADLGPLSMAAGNSGEIHGYPKTPYGVYTVVPSLIVCFGKESHTATSARVSICKNGKRSGGEASRFPFLHQSLLDLGKLSMVKFKFV